MTNQVDDKDKLIHDKIDELVKNSTVLIGTPDTFERMKAKGLPIKSTFVTYQQYLDKLFIEKRKVAEEIIQHLPQLDTRIANATISALYEELKECFVLGIPGAAIVNAIMLLEHSCRERIYREKYAENQSTRWDTLENMVLCDLAKKLKNRSIINDDELAQLLEFNENVRNKYMHYKIQQLVEGMVYSELSGINIETGEVTVEHNVDVASRTPLWFVAKRVKDKGTVVDIVSFCLHWVNKLSVEGTPFKKVET